MYNNSDLQSPANMNYKYDRAKENIYLDRIARLMETNRLTLDSYAKIKLWEDGPNYQKVVKYVNNSQCHSSIKLTVVNIHRVWLRNREDENFFHISNRKLLWHGTKRTNIPHILNSGFKLPTQAGQMFGSGIYFADRISKSSNYSDSDVTFLLLCEVGLGKVYSCRQPHNDWKSVPVGFDTVKANGTYVPDWTDSDRYIGAEIPFGRTAKCTKYQSHAVNFNEFIVYDPSRIIIRFLVEVNVERLSVPTTLKLVTPSNVVRTKNKTTRKPTDAGILVKRNGNSQITNFNPPKLPSVNTKSLRSPHYVPAVKPKLTPPTVKPKLTLQQSNSARIVRQQSTYSTSVSSYSTSTPVSSCSTPVSSYSTPVSSYSTYQPSTPISVYQSSTFRVARAESSCVIL